jgi:hypothetical protein
MNSGRAMVAKRDAESDLAFEHAVEGKVIYLLALIALVQFGYPITAYGTLALIVYETLYVSMIVVGVIIGGDSKPHMLVLAGTGFIYFAASLIYAFNPGVFWAVFITYLALIPYLLMLIWILGRFIAIVKVITRDVLYAAVALYLLIGAVFVPLYGLLNALLPGSFRDGSFPHAPVQWQQLIYFSYTNLTSTGYGDILPISWWARSLATLEMVMGGLFITIIMARLVALYTIDRENKPTEKID